MDGYNAMERWAMDWIGDWGIGLVMVEPLVRVVVLASITITTMITAMITMITTTRRLPKRSVSVGILHVPASLKVKATASVMAPRPSAARSKGATSKRKEPTMACANGTGRRFIFRSNRPWRLNCKSSVCVMLCLCICVSTDA
jgi:hypothetical protein